jgi:hypothetical protein
LEDATDAPGAGDFYYGEMEMRRHAAPDSRRRGARFSRDRGGHLVLLRYWLLSGYALRASRAFVALALTLLVFALLF